MEGSLNFFKQKFSKVTSVDKFEKDYAYHIRHTYGQEGKRVDYPPYGCTKIQNMDPPSLGETHGCPFKIYSVDNLKKILVDQNFKDIDILGIMEKKKTNEFSVACMRYYDARYPNDISAKKVGVSPNGFVTSSLNYFKNAPKNKVRIAYEDKI